MDLISRFDNILSTKKDSVTLVVVSKRRNPSEMMPLYIKRQKIFGENQVQELLKKRDELPQDIKWHMIGKLQTNKVKYIAPFISLIQSVDNLKLLREVDKRAAQHHRVIDILLQIRIAKEDSKAVGIFPKDLPSLFSFACSCQNIALRGFMGMATNTKDDKILEIEFNYLSMLFSQYKKKSEAPQFFDILSMGMTHD